MRGFTIERDILAEKDGEKGRSGYHVETWIDGTLMPDGPRTEFQLYDDDGILYYIGVFGDAEDETFGDVQYNAVLNWGEWDAGCTTIKVKRDGKWVQEIG